MEDNLDTLKEAKIPIIHQLGSKDESVARSGLPGIS